MGTTVHPKKWAAEIADGHRVQCSDAPAACRSS